MSALQTAGASGIAVVHQPLVHHVVIDHAAGRGVEQNALAVYFAEQQPQRYRLAAKGSDVDGIAPRVEIPFHFAAKIVVEVMLSKLVSFHHVDCVVEQPPNQGSFCLHCDRASARSGVARFEPAAVARCLTVLPECVFISHCSNPSCDGMVFSVSGWNARCSKQR